ncbi:MAG: glycosyltransferase family 39 protein [Planctomycetes bacterium]|nr:glycosyltransferase family 39 protein [Planctomycetota bacterium]
MYKKLLIVLLIAEALNLGGWLLQYRLADEPFMEIDSHRYWSLATGMQRYGRFTDDAGSDEFAVWHTPGYPLFLLALRKAGISTPAGVAAVQHVLLLLAVALTYATGRILLNPRAALVAAALQAVHLASPAYGNIVLTEALFVPIMMAGIVCLYRYKQTEHWRWWICAFLCIAASMFVRPIALFLAGPIALVMLMPRPGSMPMRRRAVSAVLLIVVLAAPAVAWAARNYRATGIFSFCAVSAQYQAMWNAAGVLQVTEGYSLEQAQQAIESRVHAKQLGLQRYRELNQVGWQIVREHPKAWLISHVKGVLRVMGGASVWCDLLGGKRPIGQISADPWGTLSDWKYSLPLALEWLGLAITWILAPIGLVKAIRRGHHWEAISLVLLAGYLLAVAGGPAACGRYRIVFWPLVAVLAGAAWLPGRTGCSAGESAETVGDG